jgi:hypothetical protein
MTRFRRAARTDANQAAIVRSLRCIPGVTVETGHDDILVGRYGVTRWYEIKQPGKERQLTDSEQRRRDKWQGHYRIVSGVEDILRDMGLMATTTRKGTP